MADSVISQMESRFYYHSQVGSGTEMGCKGVGSPVVKLCVADKHSQNGRTCLPSAIGAAYCETSVHFASIRHFDTR
ncbi:hypothetical protein J6590_009133 [Homalodisca vitripennis]|nr:hypothetical protein J6590_009133 [Homalodisca vitripennis]